MTFKQLPLFLKSRNQKAMIMILFAISVILGFYGNMKGIHSVEVISLLFALLAIGLSPFTGLYRNSLVAILLVLVAGGGKWLPKQNIDKSSKTYSHSDLLVYVLVTGLEYQLAIFGLLFFVIVLALFIGQHFGFVPY